MRGGGSSASSLHLSEKGYGKGRAEVKIREKDEKKTLLMRGGKEGGK